MGSNGGTESATHQSSPQMSSSPSYIDASVTSLSSVMLDETTETEVVAVTVEATTEDFSKMIGFPLINETL